MRGDQLIMLIEIIADKRLQQKGVKMGDQLQLNGKRTPLSGFIWQLQDNNFLQPVIL